VTDEEHSLAKTLRELSQPFQDAQAAVSGFDQGAHVRKLFEHQAGLDRSLEDISRIKRIDKDQERAAREATLKLLGELVAANRELVEAFEAQRQEEIVAAQQSAERDRPMLFWTRVAGISAVVGLVVATILAIAF
jgi:hypothetical protein